MQGRCNPGTQQSTAEHVAAHPRFLCQGRAQTEGTALACNAAHLGYLTWPPPPSAASVDAQNVVTVGQHLIWACLHPLCLPVQV